MKSAGAVKIRDVYSTSLLKSLALRPPYSNTTTALKPGLHLTHGLTWLAAHHTRRPSQLSLPSAPASRFRNGLGLITVAFSTETVANVNGRRYTRPSSA